MSSILRGSELTAGLVLRACFEGAFPMADDDGFIEFYQSDPRAMFPIEGIHLSRSLLKTIRRGDFEITFDQAFELVVRACRRPDGNWISEDIIRVFCELFDLGWAHSCEVWQGEDLVGGIYGLALGRVFSAESMFHRRTDMSKVALSALIARCRESGFIAFDAQVMNPHLASLGAFNISAKEYQDLLGRGLMLGAIEF